MANDDEDDEEEGEVLPSRQGGGYQGGQYDPDLENEMAGFGKHKPNFLE